MRKLIEIHCACISRRPRHIFCVVSVVIRGRSAKKGPIVFLTEVPEMSSWAKIDTFDAETGELNVIIETPKGSRNKYDFSPHDRILTLHSLLPAGSVFPYDFGFIPSTLGEDGDPLDALVIMEVAAPSGCLVPVRLLGVIEAKQTDGKATIRNDRLIAVSTESHCHKAIQTLSQLGKDILNEIEDFFISYNEIHGKKFKPLGIKGPKQALKLVQAGQDRLQKQLKKKKKLRAKK
jgi:inorganic pyrophosphatase